MLTDLIRPLRQHRPIPDWRSKSSVGRPVLQKGTVKSYLNTPFAIPYKSRHFNATVWFRDMWTVRGEPGTPFALQGDSGSLVVAGDADSAVGLVFAVGGYGDYAIVIPMTHVLQQFGGLMLVAGHGV